MSIDDIINTAQTSGKKGIVLCDSNMLGVKEFYDKCLNANIRPVIGLEIRTSFRNSENGIECPMALIALNDEGYKELIKLSTKSELNEQAVSFDDYRNSDNLAKILTYDNIIENKDDTTSYSEISAHFSNVPHMYIGAYQGMNTEKINEFLDYIQDIPSDDIQMCEFNPKRSLDQIGLDTLEKINVFEDEYIFLNGQQTVDDISEQHASVSDRLFDSTGIEIKNENSLAHYNDHSEEESYNILVEYVKKGLKEKYTKKQLREGECIERARKELSVIKNMGFANYFLVVRDYVMWAKENGIRVAPGRGSAAGSLIAYTIGITDIEPLKYDLLFERFLNPMRVTMPDIDVDFDSNRRQEVINYVSGKYGEDHVAQIVTFSSYGYKNAVKELAKGLGLTRGEYEEITKCIPPTTETESSFSLEQLYKEDPNFRSAVNKYPAVKDILPQATVLGKMPKSLGTHAGGVVISSRPLDEIVPLIKTGGNTKNVQYSKDYIESVGLLKMDLLATDTLTKMDEIDKMIKADYPDGQFDIDRCPMNDKKTYDMIAKGETLGVFQLESDLARNTIRKMHCDSFSDIIAAISLGRPGPIENLSEYCDRKLGKSPIRYTIPELEPILKDTYGIIVYQEQVMKCATDLAGMSMGQADILRKAMSKKNEKAISEMQETFVDGCKNNGISEKNALLIYNDMKKFAKYGFNKSHAVAYAYIAYQLAYCKANYPREYYCSLLNYSAKLSEIQNECRKQGINFRNPSINKSENKCITKDGDILLSLQNIKGVGITAGMKIISERNQNGPYSSVVDFVERIHPAKNTYQALVNGGALDCFGYNRTTLLNNYENIRVFAEDKNLFVTDNSEFTLLPYKEEYSKISKLEKNVLGIYISADPVTIFKNALRDEKIADINSLKRNGYVNIVGEILKINEKLDRNGYYMASIVIGDESGKARATVFANKYPDMQKDLVKGNIVKISGTYKLSEKYGNSLNISKMNRITFEEIEKLEKEENIEKTPPEARSAIPKEENLITIDNRPEKDRG